MGSTENHNRLADKQFAILGLPELAYIKPVVVDGEGRFEVHSADGAILAILEDRDTAFATVIQHDMVPMSVH